MHYRAANWTEGRTVTCTLKYPSGVTTAKITLEDVGDGLYTVQRDFNFEGEFLIIFSENGVKSKMVVVDTRRRAGVHYRVNPRE